MTLDPESLYLQLGQLAETMPDLSRAGDWSTPDGQRWLGRLGAIADSHGKAGDRVVLAVSTQFLGGVSHDQNAQTIKAVLYRLLATAELAAPAAVQGRFIAAGDALGALGAVSKVFGTAKQDLLLIDAYADHVVITDFVISAPERVQIRILGANRESRKAALKPAVDRWAQQFGTTRPLSVRVAPAAALHDRLILIDGVDVWSIGQSFNGVAKSSHTSLMKADPDLAEQKIIAYGLIWDNATPLA
ncbi:MULTISPECIES: phosphatidylserine/phosphatidylglycerophosphate/cardiolipin synthase family protein [unclassified Bradyrhizobium]|uniref:phosphatidylserine/phosphatidylglycerophosphate/ cardiolipin synthase family protein n=1 Tax=unclassified Bradyrhizobium TaxID=2631580 RepID=UPI002916BFAC|nr:MULTISPECIES: phosphatidylserine/phosphatidylglycerophosphate/cardiolipin synthase family protein [unclassified Bradyrhizobium]